MADPYRTASPLPEPHIVDRDYATILAECLATFEAATGQTLSPDMPEYLFVCAQAQREVELRIAVRQAALQNLARYAEYPMLDLLVQLIGLERRGASPALVTLRFAGPSPVPAGTRVRTNDGKYTFETLVEALPGIDVSARATSPGPGGNGYIAGRVVEVVDLPGFTATNINTTAGGAPQEDSDSLRSRIPAATHAYSTCGSRAAYDHHARAAHASIEDIDISQQGPGVVRVTVHAKPGVPVLPLVDVVADYLADERIRPLTDIIEVVAANGYEYVYSAQVWLDRDEYPVVPEGLFDTMLLTLEAAATERAASLRKRLGADITLSRLIGALQLPGVHTVTLLSPEEPLELSPDEFAEPWVVEIALMGWWP